MAEDKDLGFKVSDHRMFNPDGTPRDQEKASAEVDPGEVAANQTVGSGRVISFPADSAKNRQSTSAQFAAITEAQPGAAASEPSIPATRKLTPHPVEPFQSDPTDDWEGAGPAPDSGQPPEASFAGLVNMLAVEAAMHLGLIENPMGPAEIDLESAKTIIDLLGMLEGKTRGNLTAGEADLLENVLADLRMQFVAMSRRR